MSPLPDRALVFVEELAQGESRYVLRGRGMDVYLRNEGISYVFHHLTGSDGSAADRDGTGETPRIRSYRVDVSFPNHQADMRLEAVDGTETVETWLRGGSAVAARASSQVIYRNVYPRVDLVFTAREGRLKYDWIVHPGGDADAIRMCYAGAEQLRLDADGALLLGTPLGELHDEAPIAFSTVAHGEVRALDGTRALDGQCAPVDVSFLLSGNELRFRLGEYDRARTLILDPGILWSTFYGGSGEDWSYGIAVDASHNSYIAGRTLSANFPVAAGQQMTSAGNYDAFLVKLNAAGQRIWATYFGGSDLDYAYSVAVDGAGRVAVSGWTRSNDFPVLNAAQNTRAGDLDAFAASFTTGGQLRWSTYAGGSIEERGLAIACDGAGNALLAGSTFSTDFPVLNPAQPVHGGYSDMFIVKYDSSGARLWSTFLGGAAADEAWSISAGGGAVTVGGRTSSGDFPVAGAQQPTIGGGYDACVARYTAAGARLWSTFHGGTDDEHGLGIAVDAAGNVLLCGSTGSDDFPVLNAVQDEQSMLVDAFAAFFTASGSLQWSTYYGGNSTDIATSAAFDNSGNALIAGSTGSSTLPLRNAFAQKQAGDEAFAARFLATGALQFATYIGGGNNEGASGIAADGTAMLLTGTTNSSDFPAINAFQPGHQGGPWDAFVLKIEECSVVATAAALGPRKFCPGGSVTLQANAGSGLEYQWYRDYVKLSGADQREYLAVDSGEYSVVVKNAGGCLSRSDPIRIDLSVLKALPGPDSIICLGGSAQLRVAAEGGTAPFTYEWRPSRGLSSTTVPGPLATPDTTTQYTVIIRDSIGCADSATVNVIVRDVRVDAGMPVFICRGSSTRLSGQVDGGIPPYTYQWLPSTGLDLTGVPNPSARPDTTTVYTLTVTDALGCHNSDSVEIRVSTLKISVDGGGIICPGNGITLTANATGGTPPYTYQWAPTAGLSSSTTRVVTAQPAFTTVYTVTVTDGGGCTLTAGTTVFVLQGPHVSILGGGRGVLCPGDTLVLTASDVFPVYRWSTGHTGRSIIVVADGVYTLVVRDSAGCESRDSIAVTRYDAPQPRITALRPTLFCPGDSTVLDAGEGYAAYVWSTGERTRTIAVKQAGTFFVTVTNDGGCTGTSPPIVVSTHVAPPVSLQGWSSVCPYTSTTYATRIARNSRYDWFVQGGVVTSGAGTRFLTVLWGGPGIGRVSLRVTDDSTGCVVRDEMDVEIATQFRPHITPGPILYLCFGDSAAVDAGAGYASYSWTGPGGDTTLGRYATVARPGVYILTVRSADGCEGRDTLQVIARATPLPEIDAEPRVQFCEGDTVLLRVRRSYASYRWSTGDTTAELRTGAPGVYTVTVADSAGCSGTSPSVRLSNAPRPLVGIVAPRSVCAGAAALCVAVAPPGASLRWNAPGALIEGGTTSDTLRLSWTSAGPRTVELSARFDSSGCDALTSVSVEVRALPSPAIVLIGDSMFCEGDSAVLRSARAHESIRWSTGESDLEIVVRATGIYTLAVSDSGCEAVSAPLGITVVPRPQPRIEGPASACVGSAAVYRVTVEPGDSIQWSATGGAIASDDGAGEVQVRWTTRGMGMLSATVRRPPAGCEGRTEYLITIGDSLRPEPRALGPLSFCEGDSVMLDAGAGFASYEWRDGSVLVGSQRMYSARKASVLRVRVRDAAGCSGESDTIVVVVLPRPTVAISGPATFCDGDSVVLDAGAGALAYSWTDSAGLALSSGRRLIVRNGGSYRVMITGPNGCAAVSALHQVTRLPSPPKPVITRNGDTLISSAPSDNQWLRDGVLVPGWTGAWQIVTADGRYTVRVRNAGGCVAESDPVDVRTGIATALLRLPVLAGAPGDHIVIPVELAQSTGLAAAGVGEFRAILRLNASLLSPLGATPRGRIEGVERIIPVQAPVSAAQGTLLQFEFLAMLGDVDITSLRLDSITFGPARVASTTEDGVFRLEICREGGDRLFDAGRPLYLGQNSPNPFNAMTTVEYECIESGPVRLVVIDAFGREVALLVDADMRAGRHRVYFHAGALPSGIYCCTLRTATQKRSIMMTILR